ncbi:ketopantoate reductase family protein [Halobellus ruber]|uniref:2-dehydropantoate 2-reductase n=1 Tax=Halobellus ruber TaxID=2761102 RepID=A0A7J9SL77_9EURY|nr:ketopantoate reductase family protein [Halobellus ruber]MBB6646776.1 ketopantoate reductase family protein [Halobellus ruber]
MRIVIFGAGSLGSLFGALLDGAHDVTLVGRDPHISAVREHGLRVTGVDDFEASPAATTDGTELDCDFAVVTVKAYDTAGAARDLATGDVGAAVSLQNGLGNEATLAAGLDCPVVAGTTSHGAMLSEPGVVEWTGRGDVVVGAWRGDGAAGEGGDVSREDEHGRGTAADPASGVAAAFRAASIGAEVESDIGRRLWRKLAVNAAINPVSALARIRNGRVFEGPTAEYAARAAREAADVARAEGVDLDAGAAVEAAQTVARRTADNRSSMFQDVAAGRRTEIDAVSGVVAERADEHGVDAPVNGLLCALLRGWEAGEGLR